MCFCLPNSSKPNCRVVPGNAAPVVATDYWHGAHAGAISSVPPHQADSKVVSHFRNSAGISPSQLPSHCFHGGTQALTPGRSTERPWQGETLLPPPRWVRALQRPRGDAETSPHLHPGCVGSTCGRYPTPAVQANTGQLPRDRQCQGTAAQVRAPVCQRVIPTAGS